jgi:formate hydrogenlyase subunit 6/NADH:ubiquinone oxidoreductase subunit I
LYIRIQHLFDVHAHFHDSCTACQACVAICPIGALRTEQTDVPPVFDQLLCTGCRLCEEFCLESALQISPA